MWRSHIQRRLLAPPGSRAVEGAAADQRVRDLEETVARDVRVRGATPSGLPSNGFTAELLRQSAMALDWRKGGIAGTSNIVELTQAQLI